MAELSRPEIERLLRAAGLSHRQARKLMAVGWAGVVGEQQAEQDELRQRLAELEERLRSGA